MTSTTNLSLNLPTNGSFNNSWDVPVNANWATIDAAIGGTTAFNVVGASGTTALVEAQYGTRIWEFSGLLTANVTYQIPSGVGGFWSAVNNTTGAFTITITSAGGGTSVVLTQGYTSAIICDGTNVGYASTVPANNAGGANTQVQFNNGGVLAGSSSLTWNGSALTAPTFIGVLTGNASTATSATTAATATTATTAATATAFTGSMFGFSGLKIATNGVSNYTSTVTAAYVSVHNGTNAIALQSVSVAPVITTNGVNGLDTGTLAASTWYYVYVIYNGTTTAGLFSLSSTSPTLPSGYTYFARVGAVRTDSSGSKYLLQTLQYGRRAKYISVYGLYPLIDNGATGTFTGSVYTPVAASVSTVVPTTASGISILMTSGNTSTPYAASPNNNGYSGWTASNCPPLNANISSGVNDTMTADWILESTNIYWACGSSSTTSIYCTAWEDNL